jgi:hypothetical protein
MLFNSFKPSFLKIDADGHSTLKYLRYVIAPTRMHIITLFGLSIGCFSEPAWYRPESGKDVLLSSVILKCVQKTIVES